MPGTRARGLVRRDRAHRPGRLPGARLPRLVSRRHPRRSFRRAEHSRAQPLAGNHPRSRDELVLPEGRTGRRLRLRRIDPGGRSRSEEHTSELQSRSDIVCRLLLEKKNAHNDKSVHGVLNPTYQAGLRRDAVQPDIEAERKKRDEIEAGKSYCSRLFFFNDTATTEIYTLSLHDALPICDELVLPEGRTGRRLRLRRIDPGGRSRSEEHTSELQSRSDLVCRLLLEKKKKAVSMISVGVGTVGAHRDRATAATHITTGQRVR